MTYNEHVNRAAAAVVLGAFDRHATAQVVWNFRQAARVREKTSYTMRAWDAITEHAAVLRSGRQDLNL